MRKEPNTQGCVCVIQFFTFKHFNADKFFIEKGSAENTAEPETNLQTQLTT